MVVSALAIYADQSQGIGATPVPHPVTHGKDNSVTSRDCTETPQYLQCFLDNFFDVITFWLMMGGINIAVQRHPATAGCIGRKCIDRNG